jgi:hypothetical protein
MTDIDYDRILRREMRWAIQTKQQCKATDPDDFPMRVSVTGPKGELVRTPIRWGSMADKYDVMELLSGMCKMVHASAAIITTDARFLNIDAFCIEFNLPTPTPENSEAWEEQRRRVMEPYGFEMKNLPRHTFDETLICSAYGPRIAKMHMTPYDVVAGRFVFQPSTMTGDDEAVRVNMIPQWW